MHNIHLNASKPSHVKKSSGNLYGLSAGLEPATTSN